MADLNNNAPVDTLELDPADGQQYILELRDRMLELLSPARSIGDVEERLKKLFPDSKLIDLAINEANKPRNESSYKNHKIRNHSSSSSASFTGTLHNITSMAVAKLSKLVRDGVVGNKSENELSKYKIRLIEFIINDILKLAENFVKRQKGNFIITRSDIRTAMHADKDLLDMFLSDDKNMMITENHPILASINRAEKVGHTSVDLDSSMNYKKMVNKMVDSEQMLIVGLNLIIKVFKNQLMDLPQIDCDVRILFCNIEELHELSQLLLCDLQDAQESAGLEQEIPFVGSQILDLAQAEEFNAYFTFAYKRLWRGDPSIDFTPWRKVYTEIVSNESVMSYLRTVELKFDLAIRHQLPSYLLNVIVHFFEFFRNLSDLYELSKQHDNPEDQLALKETLSILITTKKAIEELFETEMINEEMEPLDEKQAESVSEFSKRKLAQIRNEKDITLAFMPPMEIYRFSEPDSWRNIQFEEVRNRASKDLDKHTRDDINRTPVIRCATITKLVERLTYHKSTPDIVDSFLTTYRSFIAKPEDLMDLLIERFKVPDPPIEVVVPNFTDWDRLTERDRRAYKIFIHHFRQNYSKPVKIRVINVLKTWIRNHYYDFERHPILLQKLDTFLDEVYVNEKILRTQIDSIKTIAQKKICQGDAPKTEKLPEIPWWTAQGELLEKSDLLTFHPADFARQLTLFEFDLFRAIKPSLLINQRDLSLRSGEEDKSDSSPNLSRLTRHFTLFSYWIRKSIVETSDLDKRVKVYSRSIEIMALLRELNNFMGLLSIGSAIESAPIGRLTLTQSRLSHAIKKVLADYRELTDKHLSKLQDELEHCNPPCIPYLGSYQTKLIHAEEGNRTIMDETTDTTTISPTLSAAGGFQSSFSNSPITPRTPLRPPSSMQVSSPILPLSADSMKQNKFFGSPTSGQPEPKLINFSKQRIRAGLVAEISNYQNLPYSLAPQPEIRKFIESIEVDMINFAKDQLEKRGQASKNPSVSAMTKILDDYLFDQLEFLEPKKPHRDR